MFKNATGLSDDSIIKEFNEKKYWGEETLINLYGCDVSLMQDKEYIKEFIVDLCDFIDMKRYGEPTIERFGEGNLFGISFTQLIYTSCITGHFSEVDGRVFIDIFSCRSFLPEVTAKFVNDYFHGKKHEVNVLFRD